MKYQSCQVGSSKDSRQRVLLSLHCNSPLKLIRTAINSCLYHWQEQNKAVTFYGFREAECANVCPFTVTSAPWNENVREIRAWVRRNLSLTARASFCLNDWTRTLPVTHGTRRSINNAIYLPDTCVTIRACWVGQVSSICKKYPFCMGPYQGHTLKNIGNKTIALLMRHSFLTNVYVSCGTHKKSWTSNTYSASSLDFR